MAAAAQALPDAPAHIPVLLRPLLAAVAPINGTWIDGTFGAGGYARGLLDGGADKVIGLDRDPDVIDQPATWTQTYAPRLELVRGNFAELDQHAQVVAGVVLDLGLSSMQLDQPQRGFSFMNDGPLDMRMGQQGTTAADLINNASEIDLADILYHYGEERAARRIARSILAKRRVVPIVTTSQLRDIVTSCLPRPKPGQSHPATRSFQAIRIAVNDEFGQLLQGLEAAERALGPGGRLAVVSFHSLEDRIVKRFLAERSDTGGGGSRYAPEPASRAPGFDSVGRAIAADDAELAENPRARSARLRIARRTNAPAMPVDKTTLGLPKQVSWETW